MNKTRRHAPLQRGRVVTHAKARRVVQRGSTGRLRLYKGAVRRPSPEDKGQDGAEDAAPSTSVRPATQLSDEAALLRELNAAPGSASASAAALYDALEGDSSWATEDLEAFSRAKAQEAQAQRSPRAGQRAASPPSERQSATSTPQTTAASTLPSGTKLTGVLHGSLAVKEAYVDRNPEVLRALRMLGRSITVEGDSHKASGPTDVSSASWSATDAARMNRAARREAQRKARLEDSAAPGTADGSRDGQGSDDTVAGLGDGWLVKTSPEGDVYLERQPRAVAPRQTPTSYEEADRPAAAAASTDSGSAAVEAALAAAATAAANAGKTASTAPGGSNPARPGAQALPAVLAPSYRIAPALRTALRSLSTPEQVLDLAALLWPQWAQAGCRLAAPALLAVSCREERQSAHGLGVAPTPAEAALVLQGLATACRKAGWRPARRLELCTEPRVIGLLEALRVQPPRLSAEQQSNAVLGQALTRSFFKAAKAWWLAPPPHTPQLSPQPPVPAAENGASAHMPATNTARTSPSASQQHSQPTPSHSPTAGYINGHVSSHLLPLAQTITVKLPDTGVQLAESLSPTAPMQQPGQPVHSSTSMSAADFAAYVSATGSSNMSSVSFDDRDVHDAPAAAGSLGVPSASPVPRRTGPGEQYESLLSRYKAQTTTPPRQTSTQQATGSIGVEGLRNQTMVAAMSAMATLGGAAVWGQHMSSVLAVATAGGVQWRQMSPSEAATMAWCLATCRHFSTVLDRLDAGCAATGGVCQFNPTELARLLWSYASLNTTPVRLLDSFRPDWTWRQGTEGGELAVFPTPQLITCLWSLAVLRQTHHPAFRAGWHELLCRGQGTVATCGPVLLTQLWQAAMAVWLDPHCANDQREAPHVTAPLSATQETATAGSLTSGNDGLLNGQGAVTACVEAGVALALSVGGVKDSSAEIQQHQHGRGVGVLRAAHSAFAAGSAAVREGSRTGHSAVQRQMANAVVGLRLMHVVEDVTSGYAVDVSLPQLHIAIEADGPTHFARTPGPKSASTDPLWVMGPTALKRRHLRALGWSVLAISLKEWEAAGSPAAQQRLVEHRINKVVRDRAESNALRLTS